MTPCKVIMLAFLALLAAAGGCAPLEQVRPTFVETRNAEIGDRFPPPGLPSPVQMTPLENGKIFYLFQDEKTGCRWSCEVDRESGIIEFWQYEGNPNLCQ